MDAQPSKPAKRTRIKPLTPEQRKLVAEHIKANDFKWWFERRLIKAAKEQAAAKLGFEIPPSAFKAARLEANCEWFKTQRRPSPSKNTALDSGQWDELAAAVRSQLHLLQGRTIDEAVAIVSLEVKCNASTLAGLRSELRVWDSGLTRGAAL